VIKVDKDIKDIVAKGYGTKFSEAFEVLTKDDLNELLKRTFDGKGTGHDQYIVACAMFALHYLYTTEV